jgi:hypothetical protein
MTFAGRPPYIAGKSAYLVCFKWKPGFRVLLGQAIKPTDRLFAIHLNALEKKVYLFTLLTKRRNFLKIKWKMPCGLM